MIYAHQSIIKKLDILKEELLLNQSSLLKSFDFSVISIKEFSKKFKKRAKLHEFFTEEEISYCSNRIASYAGRYAAKEAIRRIFKQEIPWKDINISSSNTGEPILIFKNASLNGLNISISITHESDLVIALAARPKNNKNIFLGVDATRHKRFRELIKNSYKVVDKILTKEEIKNINNIYSQLPKIWTGKEAISKALGIGIWHGSALQEIELIQKKDFFSVQLYGNSLKEAEKKYLKSWKLEHIGNSFYIVALSLGFN